MNVIDTIIQDRKATRFYDPTFKIDSETTERLIKLGQAAPSSFNIQHCRFLVVRDQELRQQIRSIAMNQAQITDASLLIVVCAKIDSWKEDISQKWNHTSKQVQGFIRQSIDEFYQNNTTMQRDEAIRSSGMASQNLMLAAQGMGLQSGALVGFDFKKVAKLIHLPNNYIISNFIVIGRSNEVDSPKSPRLPLTHVLFENTFKL
ncbi:MAG: nitroreductase family protein [Aureispira sp.]